MLLRCQCASIAVRLENPPPEDEIPLYICHCTQCRLQSSSLFGTSAIFPASVIFPLSNTLKAKLSVWTRPTKEGRSMDCYFCKSCGTRLMHRIREADGSEQDAVTLKGGCVFLDHPDAESLSVSEEKERSVTVAAGESLELEGGEGSRGLDFGRAVHIFTENAVVDLGRWPGSGVKMWEGSPEVMEGRPGHGTS